MSSERAERLALSRIPKAATSFVGRSDELDRLLGELAEPECRLVTIVGPGGVGKTRLATEAARVIAEDSGLEVCFAGLDGLRDPLEIPLGVAAALGVPLASPDTAAVQLARIVGDREMLIVLDNFEHLVEGAEFLSELLAATERLTLLVTSRILLGLQEEWVFLLDGLAVPEEGVAAESDAVRLFRERARQAGPSDDVALDVQAIARICRLVGGLPLAIELAAAWLRHLSLAEIEQEVGRNVEFLETTLRNVPERHRSLHSVFDQSYEMLAPMDRLLFDRLTVFGGGFTRETAREFLGANLAQLARLADCSLIRMGGNGRYTMHELLRQYGKEHLTPAALEELLRAHADFFTTMVERSEQAMVQDQARASASIEAELTNVRHAWHWAIEHGHVALIGRLAPVLWLILQHRARYREAESMYRAGLETVARVAPTTETHRLLAIMSTCRAWFLVRLGHLDEAVTISERARRHYEASGARIQPGLGGDPDTVDAVVHLTLGEFDAARRCSETARRRAESEGNDVGLAINLWALGQAALAEGAHDEARLLDEQSLEAASRGGELWFTAYVHNDLGTLALARGDLTAAADEFERAYEIRKLFDDPEGMALAAANLAKTAVASGDLEGAQRLYVEAFEHYRDLGDIGGLAQVLAGMGETALRKGDHGAAAERLGDALDRGCQIQFTTLALRVLRSVADLQRALGDAVASAEILGFVAGNPAADREVRLAAEADLEQLATRLTDRELAAARRRGEAHELAPLAETVIRVLRRPAALTRSVDHAAPSAQISDREMEVLSLLAGGKSNPDIASALGIGVGTVKWHTSQLYGKLGVRNRTQAVAAARALGVVP